MDVLKPVNLPVLIELDSSDVDTLLFRLVLRVLPILGLASGRQNSAGMGIAGEISTLFDVDSDGLGSRGWRLGSMSTPESGVQAACAKFTHETARRE